jgi:lipoprotein-anchoring transpeptidase ErfK/SrfK
MGAISPIRPDARGGRRKVAILIGALFVAALALAYGYDRVSAEHFYPGTRIGSVGVGSLTADEAEAKLHERYVVPLRQRMTLSAPEFETTSTPWEMGMRVDVSDAARDALVSQQAEPIVVRLWHRVAGDPTNVKIRPQVDDGAFGRFLSRTFRRINQEPEDARLDVSRDELDIIPHKLGRTVDKRAAEGAIFSALTSGHDEVEIPVKVVQPELRTEAFDRVLLISTSANRLVFYRDGKVAKTYGVATGTGGYPTPHGQWRITAKRMNPTWYNPNSEWSQGMPAFIPPGPRNPLGTRALNLSASGIRIHGTPDSWSIGTNASHGCIRMHMRDVEELFEQVEVGTPVLIV